MKKKNKTKKARPFDAEIRQMRSNKVILVTGIKVKPFIGECEKRGIQLGEGSDYNGGKIFYES